MSTTREAPPTPTLRLALLATLALAAACRSAAGGVAPDPAQAPAAADAGAPATSASPVVSASPDTPIGASSFRFDFGPGPAATGYTAVGPALRYDAARGYGFLPGAELRAVAWSAAAGSPAPPAVDRDVVTGEEPFYFSVAVPEGAYRVTMTLGHPDRPTTVTVKAESRRLMLEAVRTAPREVVTRSFTVDVRNSRIEGGGEVRLKDREVGAFHWDDRLTLELNGDHPTVAAIEIEPETNPVTVYLAGNSTVTDQTREPWAAWGQMLPRFFQPGVAVANHAESGETLKAFVAENRLRKVMSRIRPGDYLFIQFAHNDQKPGPSHLAPFTGYEEYLGRFIDEARAHGAHPVLVTSMHRRSFDDAGRVVNTHGDYPEAMRQVAADRDVPLIDLHAMSEAFYEALGPEGSKRAFVHYPAGSFPGQDEPLADDSHHSPYGAYELAKAVVQAIRDAGLPLADRLLDGLATFDPAHPDPPDRWNLPPSPRASVERPAGS